MEERCTLTHELIHHAHSHNGHQKSGVERKVRYETALLLLPTIDYHESDVSIRFAADEYGVTEAVKNGARFEHPGHPATVPYS